MISFIDFLRKLNGNIVVELVPKTEFHFGDDEANLLKYGWFEKNAEEIGSMHERLDYWIQINGEFMICMETYGNGFLTGILIRMIQRKI